MELGGSYTAPSGDNVFVTAAANLTLDGVSIESNLIEGERLSIRWETPAAARPDRRRGEPDHGSRDVDWGQRHGGAFHRRVAQAAEEIGGRLSRIWPRPDFRPRWIFSSATTWRPRAIIRRSITGSPVTCTAEDLGRLFHTLADQMERDDALLPYIERSSSRTPR